MNGRHINITNIIIKLYGANIVVEVGIASVTAPPVAFIKASFPGVASARGIEPENPACQTTKPEYADAISNL